MDAIMLGAWMGLAGCGACCVLAVLSSGNGRDCVRRSPPGPRRPSPECSILVFGTIQRFVFLLPFSVATYFTASSSVMAHFQWPSVKCLAGCVVCCVLAVLSWITAVIARGV